MSASLVGSEMCIRDSIVAVSATEVRGVRAVARRPLGERWSREALQGLVSVSYTHLTLPTICSV
eukprot:3882814-Alexandrium_andersonii.AAC.1